MCSNWLSPCLPCCLLRCWEQLSGRDWHQLACFGGTRPPSKAASLQLRMLISLQMFSPKPQAPTALTPSPPSQSIAKGKTKKAEPFLTRQGGVACRVDPQRGSPESPQGYQGVSTTAGT